MYLIDSNVFLEALLKQKNYIKAQHFLKTNSSTDLFITDFTLHSIAILLIKDKNPDLLKMFISEVVLDKIQVLHIKTNNLKSVIKNSTTFKLDFDDAYQYTVAKQYNLRLVSFDKDFDKTDIKRIEP